MTTPLPHSQLADLASFVKRELVELNCSCRGVPAKLSEWISATAAAVDGIDTTVEQLDADQSLVALNLLGFVAASGERHAQLAGHRPGWILGQFAGLERAMVVAASGTRAPALTAELYWQRNDGADPWSFTNEAHELFYISVVRTQIELRATVNRQLRALSHGWRLDTVEGARMLRVASAAMRETRCQYMDMRRGIGPGVTLTAANFDDLRGWQAPTIVGGQRLDGPDIADLADLVATDILLGTVDSQYEAYARSRGRYQSPDGRAMIEADLQRTSLALMFIDALGLPLAAFDRTSTAEVVRRLRRAPAALLESLEVFATLIDHHIGASGAHLGLMGTLLGETRQASRTAYQWVSEQPSHGEWSTQDRPAHEQVHRLHHMRRKAPRVTKLVAAFRQSQRNGSQPALIGSRDR